MRAGSAQLVRRLRIQPLAIAGPARYGFTVTVLCSHSYKYSHILLTRHALNVSMKTVRPLSPSLARGPRAHWARLFFPQSIRTNDQGLVSFQFMIPMSTRGPKASMKEGKIGFVEFLVSPQPFARLVVLWRLCAPESLMR